MSIPSSTSRKFPVIDETPSFGTTVRHARLSDWLLGASVAAAMLPVGYFIGRPIRGPVMGFMFSMGVVAGVMMASQNAGARLMGFSENARELRSLGKALH